MTTAAHPWFPPGTLGLASVRSAMAARIDEWSQRWFAKGRRPRLSCLRAVETVADRPRDDRALDRGGVRLRATAQDRDLLTAMALGLGETEARPSAADRPLLDLFVEEMLRDLLEALCDIAGSEAFGTPAAAVELGDGDGRPLCTIQLDRAGLAALVQTALPPRRSGWPGLSPRAKALASTPVPLELRFGRGEVPIRALRDLVPGDILVLDRPMAVGPDIALRDSAGGFARVSLKAGEDRTEIQFTQKIG